MRRRSYLAAIAGGGLASLAGCTGSLTREEATIHAPERAMLDERLDFTVTDVASEEPVWIEAHTEDGTGHPWAGRGLFEPDDGRVDLETARPVRGTYDEPAGMGLFWSMHPADRGRDFYDADQRVQSVTLRAVPDESDASPLAETSIERRLAAPDSEETEIEDPIVGTLVESPDHAPAPGVVLFHGASGGRPIAPARVLASHGFTVLALQYFSPEYADLPDALVEVPIEYADRAVEWLAAHDATTDASLGLGGFSRGGELALFLGTRHENVGAVVNWVGPARLLPAHDPEEETPDTSAWTLDGEPVAAIYDPPADTEIPLEEIEAPILLVSVGTDPSQEELNRAEERLEAVDYEYRFEHHTYDEAGHVIGIPYLPAWPNRIGGPYLGTMAATAAAAADSWPRVIEFFELGAEQ